MGTKIRDPYSPRKSRNNVKYNGKTTSTDNRNTYFLTFKRSEHIRNQYVGAQYAKQSLEVAETIEANEHRNELFMTLEIKCNR